MAYRNTHRSFQKIFMIVFAVAFGVVALAIGYQAMQQNTEGRSKAAEEQTIVKQWEFNGKDTEGWKVPVGTAVNGGYLWLPVVYQIGIMNGAPSTQPTKQSILSIENSQVGAVFPVGKKLVKLMVAVGPGETLIGRGNAESDASPQSPPMPPVPDRKYTNYVMKVSYAVTKNPSKYIPIQQITGSADGQLHEMVFSIPSNINKLAVSGLRVEILNVPTDNQVRIDWIRLAGSRGTIVPTPTPTRCTGPNGSSCSTTICPVCKPGQICPSMPCQITTGTCQNGQCIPQTCYPRPRCLRGDEYSDCQYAGAPPPLPSGATYCPITPTPTPSIGNKISWRTQTVSLEADDFYIIANGKKYYAKPDPGTTMSVGSDPGGATYTTLEATWTEQGAEMRLYMYFKADTKNWWSYEMRTYNGVKYVQNVSYPDWIYYYGPFFKSPLGTSVAVLGDSLFKSSPESKYQGNMFFRNLRLSVNFRGTTPSPFCTPQPCPVPKEGCYYSRGTACSCGTLICSTTSITPIPPVGCRYKPVECFKAPCEQIMVCTTDAQSQ